MPRLPLLALAALALSAAQQQQGAEAKASVATDKAAFLKSFDAITKEHVIEISREESEWIDVLAQGWVGDDLTGFMTEKQMLKSLHYEDPPVPIVMSCDLDVKQNGTISTLGLTFGGEKVGILSNVEIFEHLKEERAARTFGLIHPEHPYIKTSINAGHKSLCGGSLEVVQEVFPKKDGLDEFRLTPKQLQAKFWTELKADAVFVFQLRNPIHNGHALLMKDTYAQLKKKGYKKPVLWINPLGGWTKDDDVPLDVRMAQHNALLKNKVFGEELPVVLSIFPSPMLYAGPREVQWHALARQKVGATHYIVGRDPAGMKHPGTKEDIYSMWHGQEMLKMNPKFTMTIVPFQFAAYDKTTKQMSFFDPKRKDDFVSISGTKMRKLAAENEQPPNGFMDPDGWNILVDYYRQKMAAAEANISASEEKKAAGGSKPVKAEL